MSSFKKKEIKRKREEVESFDISMFVENSNKATIERLFDIGVV